jgi:hypothetical protein
LTPKEEEAADMLLKKTAWFRKSGLTAISFMLTVSISGCSDRPQEATTVVETISEVQLPEEKDEEAEKMMECCRGLYEKAVEEKRAADLEIIRSIVNRFGENGYPAVDSRNQIDMTEAEQVEWFCEMVDTQEEAEITIIEVSYLGGFVKYDLETKDGNVDVVRSYYKYENGNMKREVSGGVLELYRRRLSYVFRSLVFGRIICTDIERSGGAYCITSTAFG